MGIIARNFPGLFSGLLVSRLIPGTRAQGLACALTGRANAPGQLGPGLLVRVPVRYPRTPR